MAAEEIQLEHYEVAVSSSALKQLTWQIDPVTPAESTASYKSQSGAVLTLISKEKVIELIESGLISASGVYIIAADVATLQTLLAATTVLNIFYTGPDITNLSVNLTSDKNVYSYSADTINIISGSVSLSFPTIIGDITGGGTTAFLRFYTGLTNDATTFFSVNGIDSDTTGIKIATLKGSEILSASSANAPIEYEVNAQQSLQTNANVNHAMWSGLNVSGKLKDDSFVKVSPKDSTFISREIKDVNDVGTTSTAYNSRTIEVKDNSFAVNPWIKKLEETLIDVGSNYDPLYGISLEGNSSLNLMKEQSNTLLAIGSLPFPWIGYDAIDDGLAATYSSSPISGICHNAYCQTGTWRAKVNGFCTRRETESNGDVVEYSTATSILADDPCNFVEKKRTTPEGTISRNGATIPIDLNSSYSFVFNHFTCTMTHKTTGEEVVCVNIYYTSGSVFKSLSITGATCMYYVIKTGAFQIRESTLVASSVGQTMIMTNVVPTS